MCSQAAQEYYLFLDESGEFMETSTVPAERARGAQQPFASQVVGFLAPKREGITEDARAIMRRCFAAARLPTREEFHATTDTSLYSLNAMLRSLIEGLQAQGWQPVRLVNEEHVSYGPRVATYTNMVAELVLRLLQEKAKHSKDRIAIRLVGDLVSLPERNALGYQQRIPRRAYLERIQEYLGFAAVRRGLTREALRWEVPDVKLDVAARRPELQICDLLSNASHKKYVKCSPQNQRLLRAAFGVFDQTMQTYDLPEQLDRLIEEQTFGPALILLAEHSAADEGAQPLAEGLNHRLQYIIVRLAQMGVRGRDAQLTILIAWLDQLVGQQRLIELAPRITGWLLAHVDALLREELQFSFAEHTLDWFAYAVRRWALTAANHRGALLDAEAELRAMQLLQPSLARQWERLPLLMDGLIVQAVHQTDCFDFAGAAAQMEWIADSLKLHSQALERLMPQELAEPLRYDLRGKALGTLVQCLTLAGFSELAEAARARVVSDEAIAEFASFDDKARQYQYRCHLETVAGDFAAARRFLVKSLCPMDEEPRATTHEAIQQLIRAYEPDEGLVHRFALTHWLRLGATACLHDAADERAQFLRALDASRLLSSVWCSGKINVPPAHIVMRYAAALQAARCDRAAAQRTLVQLQAITPVSVDHLVLLMNLIAAQADVTALLWDAVRTAELLNAEQGPVIGLRQLVRALQSNSIPAVHSLTEAWPQQVELMISGQLSAQQAKEALFQIARAVRF
jgi:hypothetical protein